MDGKIFNWIQKIMGGSLWLIDELTDCAAPVGAFTVFIS